MRIVVAGCGLIGKKRAKVFSGEDKVVACCDTNEEAGKMFADEFGCKYFPDHATMLREIECDAVVVAVVNKFAPAIIIDAISKGLHVIAEKPLGRNAGESKQILEALEKKRKSDNKFIVLKTGFNHRFHPAVWKAKELVESNTIGKLMTIRARYGHGGRAGMEKEWRASSDLCGGGELLDQGVHVIDLCRWFGGDIRKVFGVTRTSHWQIDVEDNAFVYMESEKGINTQFHVSWTNWKNIFSFEIFGDKGYISITGLGGSYGTETLEIGIRKPEGGRPDIQFIEYPADDISWKMEWDEFKRAINQKSEPVGSGYDGHKANEIIAAIYKSSDSSSVTNL